MIGALAETCALAVPELILTVTLELALGLGTVAVSFIVAEPPSFVLTVAFALVFTIFCNMHIMLQIFEE